MEGEKNTNKHGIVVGKEGMERKERLDKEGTTHT